MLPPLGFSQSLPMVLFLHFESRMKTKISFDTRMFFHAIDEANGPTSKCAQRPCHDTLPWLISVSLASH